MKRRVLIVGHADADGHVIVEQIRRNLEVTRVFEVATVVDPARTRDHKAWLHLDAIGEIDGSDLVLFADLMFSPTSFGPEADALVKFAQDRPRKQFFVLDHHPLPLRRLSCAHNIRAIYRQDVLDCTVGPSSPMMVIAALYERQPTRARKKGTEPVYQNLVQGVRRAAALGGSLPGKKLSALLRDDRWKELEMLGREDATEHRLPHGYRPASEPPSKALEQLDRIATQLLEHPSSPHEAARSIMSFDFDAVTDRRPPTVTTYVPQSDDLETIVTLMELAAIDLTSEPGATFTFDQLLDQANVIGGGVVVIDKTDAEIVLDKSVLGKAAFLKKEGKRLRLK